MKTKLNSNRIILNLLIAVFVFTTSSELTAQEKKSTDLKKFKILVENTDNGIKMQSIEGSAWIDLSFSLSNGQPQAIDEFGMTDLNKGSSKKDSNFAGFLFTIVKNDNGIELKGIEGTAWTDLNFSLAKNKKQAIDQYGMTKLN